jgi:hypothetical protein
MTLCLWLDRPHLLRAVRPQERAGLHEHCADNSVPGGVEVSQHVRQEPAPLPAGGGVGGQRGSTSPRRVEVVVGIDDRQLPATQRDGGLGHRGALLHC